MKTSYPLWILIGLLILIVALPIKQVPYNISSTAKINPVKEWRLIREENGNLYSRTLNNRTKLETDFVVYKFERGDITNLDIYATNNSDGLVSLGDSIASVKSFMLDEQIANLSNELALEEATLKSKSTGQKASVINQAEQKLKFAAQNLELKRIEFVRAQNLISDSIISLSEYDAVENAYKLAEIQVGIEKSNLVSVRTGEKQETVNLIVARLNSLESQLKFLRRKKAQYQIYAPFTGTIDFNTGVVMNTGQDVIVGLPEIIAIDDTSSYVLSIPIKISDSPFMTEESVVKFSSPITGDVFTAKVIDVDDHVVVLGSDQVVMMKAIVEKGDFASGLYVQAKIEAGKITVLEYLGRTLGM